MATTITSRIVQPITVRKITLWKREIESTPGALARVLEPLASNGTDLPVVMRYRHPTEASKAVIEVCPQANKHSLAAVQAAGLRASSVPAIVVEGGHVPGVEYAIAKVIADRDIQIMFLVIQTIGDKYMATIGFETDTDAEKAISALMLIKLEGPAEAPRA